MYEDIAQHLRQAMHDTAALRASEIETIAHERFVSEDWVGTVYKLAEESNARFAAVEALLEETATAVIQLCERSG